VTGTRGSDAYAEVAGYGHARASEEDLVKQHAPLVKRLAHHLAGRLPDSVQIDDLIQAGMLGLLEAARRFRADAGARFETYATTRIRGAMVDALRPSDWTPRSVSRRARELAEAVQRVEHRLGRAATDAEIMAELGLDADAYHQATRDVAASRVLSLDELAEAGGANGEPADPATPEAAADRGGLRALLAKAIRGLPEREQQVLALYYDEELNLREIGQVLGVSESRVCQIHGQALARLRARTGAS
jgi:RNA polymerase sigma factor for flagellar operon FliA